MTKLIEFLKKLFPFFFKTASTEPAKAPTIDAVTPVAITLPAPVGKDPIDHSVTGAVIGTITEALTGRITGTGSGYVTGATSGPLPPSAPTVSVSQVMDVKGQPYQLVQGTNPFIIPVNNEPVLIETADFYDRVDGVLKDQAGNILASSSDNAGHLYLYVNLPGYVGEYHLEVVTGTTNPQAHIERR